MLAQEACSFPIDDGANGRELASPFSSSVIGKRCRVHEAALGQQGSFAADPTFPAGCALPTRELER